MQPAAGAQRPIVMPLAAKAVACLLAVIALQGCGKGANSARADAALGHGSLTNQQFAAAVAVARAEARKDEAVLTSATATIGDGTETDPNAGPACTSGKLLHIKLIGTFPHIVTGGLPPPATNGPVTIVLVSADAISGKPCLIGVRTDAATPEPGAVLLFAK